MGERAKRRVSTGPWAAAQARGAAPNTEFSYAELEWVLARASDLSAEGPGAGFTREEARALARELGINDGALRRAFRELDERSATSAVRLGSAVSERRVPVPARVVAERLHDALSRRHMDACDVHGTGCWVQRRDWWPDLERIGSEVHLRTEIQPIQVAAVASRGRGRSPPTRRRLRRLGRAAAQPRCGSWWNRPALSLPRFRGWRSPPGRWPPTGAGRERSRLGLTTCSPNWPDGWIPPAAVSGWWPSRVGQ